RRRNDSDLKSKLWAAPKRFGAVCVGGGEFGARTSPRGGAAIQGVGALGSWDVAVLQTARILVTDADPILTDGAESCRPFGPNDPRQALGTSCRGSRPGSGQAMQEQAFT